MKTYISLFSGAGVGCYGFLANTFKCIATNELLDKRLNIQKINKKCDDKNGYILGSIADSEVQNKIQDQCNLWGNTIDVLIATPPCQGMSLANHKKKNDEIKRNSLVVEAIKQVIKIQPKFFIFENVSRFLKSACTDLDGIDKTIDDAINTNLSSYYVIDSRVLNFKNYGNNSSRTRTIVIGIRKDLHNISHENLFPTYREEKTLKEIIGHLPSLNTMGEFHKQDILHSFRQYQEKMIPWMQNTSYGKSAFDNIQDQHKPHKIVNNEIVFNKNKNGDKYKRQKWENVAPCIHTRNDILASQNTVHPIDDRVFSIRELMLMMTIPKSFKWFPNNLTTLNKLSQEEKALFMKKYDVTIRQSIGEAVPTNIFKELAKKIGDYLDD